MNLGVRSMRTLRRSLLRRRSAVAATVVALVAIVMAPVAFATTVNYFGYANLTANNPPSGSCFSGSVAGLACSGWNYWDYSQADWNSGRSAWILGFLCQADGNVYGCSLGVSRSPPTRSSGPTSARATTTALWLHTPAEAARPTTTSRDARSSSRRPRAHLPVDKETHR